MKKKLTYKEFKSFLLQEGYSLNEIIHLFKAIKETDKETRGWVIDWFNGEGYPDKVIESVTADFLITDYGMKPLNAFLTLDWLKHNPQTAKYFILKQNPDIQISEDVQNEMKAFLESRNIIISQPAEEPNIPDIES